MTFSVEEKNRAFTWNELIYSTYSKLIIKTRDERIQYIEMVALFLIVVM